MNYGYGRTVKQKNGDRLKKKQGENPSSGIKWISKKVQEGSPTRREGQSMEGS